MICSKIADACIEGHNIAEERLRAEAEVKKETEEAQEGGPIPSEEATEGPEVIIVSRKEDSENRQNITEE